MPKPPKKRDEPEHRFQIAPIGGHSYAYCDCGTWLQRIEVTGGRVEADGHVDLLAAFAEHVLT